MPPGPFHYSPVQCPTDKDYRSNEAVSFQKLEELPLTEYHYQSFCDVSVCVCVCVCVYVHIKRTDQDLTALYIHVGTVIQLYTSAHLLHDVSHMYMYIGSG